MRKATASRNVILADWGSTNLRAYLLDGSGALLESYVSRQGVKHLELSNCAEVVRGLIGKWGGHGDIASVLLAGMVGSDLGWRNVDLVQCPAGLREVAGVLHEVAVFDSIPILIVPGVFANDGRGMPGMMRGEEVQIVGALGAEPANRGIYCLPGTHTKWVEVRDAKIAGIVTAMTGEIFAFLATKSVLASSLGANDSGRIDLAPYRRGLAIAASGPGALQSVFNARVKKVLGLVTDADELRSETSGILIGSEVRAMLEHYGDRGPISVISSPEVGQLYVEALLGYGQQATLIDERASFIQGGMRILGACMPGTIRAPLACAVSQAIVGAST